LAELGSNESALLLVAALFAIYQLQLSLGGALIDWDNVWVAAKALLHGDPPYGTVVHGGDYVRPPFSTVIFAPVGVLPERLSGQIMVVLNFAGFVAGLLLAAHSQRVRRGATIVALFAFSISTPFAAALASANVDALSMAPLGAALVAMRKNRWILAGVLIGVTLAVKPSFVAFALAPLLLGSLRGTVVAGTTVGALSLLATPFISEGGRFFTEVVPFLVSGHTAGVNYSLKGVLDHYSAVPHIATSIARLVALGVVVWVGFRARGLLRRDMGACVVFLLCATVLLSGYFLIYYCVFLGLGLGIIEKVRTRGEWLALGLATYLFLTSDVLRSSITVVDAVGAGHIVLAALISLGLLRSIAAREASGVLVADTPAPPAHAAPTTTARLVL
jgi:arabinofuranan 3-O-arabinosyltransferase